jgi:hypothetical protein
MVEEATDDSEGSTGSGRSEPPSGHQPALDQFGG